MNKKSLLQIVALVFWTMILVLLVMYAISTREEEPKGYIDEITDQELDNIEGR